MTKARAALQAIGLLPDTEIDIGDAALQLARIDAPDADWEAAHAHLSDLARDAVELANKCGQIGARLRHVLAGHVHLGPIARGQHDGLARRPARRERTKGVVEASLEIDALAQFNRRGAVTEADE